MKLDKKILEEKIRQYRKTKSCSESTLIGLCETADADITKEEMIKLGCGFAGIDEIVLLLQKHIRKYLYRIHNDPKLQMVRMLKEKKKNLFENYKISNNPILINEFMKEQAEKNDEGKVYQLADGSLVTCFLYDTNGQEQYDALSDIYYRDADGCLLVYDITNKESFDSIKNTCIPKLKEKYK